MSIKESIATLLVNSGATVRKNVVETLYQNELTKRTDACINIVAKIDSKTKELEKISKADNIIYDKDGNPVTEGYTKTKVDEIRRVRVEIETLEKALSSALENNDFAKALELGKN